jgi:hypothetical protein
MNGFLFFQYIPGELYQRSSNTYGSGKYVNIEAGAVKAALEQITSFLYKAEITTKGKIRQCIVNQQQAECCNRYPEEHPEKYVY